MLTLSVQSLLPECTKPTGKTTLETYLLQHHIWLTSNAKTLLTIVPGHPWINFALASILFVLVSKELYRITMSLRYVRSLCGYYFVSCFGWAVV